MSSLCYFINCGISGTELTNKLRPGHSHLGPLFSRFDCLKWLQGYWWVKISQSNQPSPVGMALQGCQNDPQRVIMSPQVVELKFGLWEEQILMVTKIIILPNYSGGQTSLKLTLKGISWTHNQHTPNFVLRWYTSRRTSKTWSDQA